MVISGIATSKNHIELLVPVRSETGFVILGKFWSRFDLRQHRNRKVLGDDQGFLSEPTVLRATKLYRSGYELDGPKIGPQCD